VIARWFIDPADLSTLLARAKEAGGMLQPDKHAPMGLDARIHIPLCAATVEVMPRPYGEDTDRA
jgi:hypothetical protein